MPLYVHAGRDEGDLLEDRPHGPDLPGLCETTIRQERVIVPLAGGRQAFEPAQTTNPCPGGLTTQDLNLDTNPNGTVLGTPS